MMQKDTILLLDDDKLILRLLEAIVQSFGYHVQSFSLATKALSWLKENRADLVISDLMMPEIDGVEFFKRIRADRNIPFMPFIILTSLKQQEMEDFTFSHGVDEYLTKPIDKAILEKSIRHLLKQTEDFRMNKNVSIMGTVFQSFDENVLEHLHTILMSYKTGIFEIVKNQIDEGFIWIKEGQFYDAKYRGYSGKEAINEILQLSSGDYAFTETSIHSVQKEIEENALQLLMDLCKDIDEKRHSFVIL